MNDETIIYVKTNSLNFKMQKRVSLALIILKVLYLHCIWSCIIITHYDKRGFHGS